MTSLIMFASIDCDYIKSNDYELKSFNNFVILVIKDHEKKKVMTIIGIDLVMTLKQIIQSSLDNNEYHQR